MAIELAAQGDGPLRRLRISHAGTWAALAIDPLAVNFIGIGCTAELPCGDLAQFVDGIGGGHKVGARHGE